MASRALPRTLSLVLAGALLIGATACAPERPAVTTPDSTKSAAVPTPTPVVDDPDVLGTPVGISCSELVDDQTIYDWGSGNFALDPDYAPAAGSDAAKVVDYEGLACGWINLTSGEKLAVAVANLPASAIDEKRSTLDAESSPVTDFGDEGWFSVDGGVGVADVIRGSYWIVASSTYFSAPTDATPIVDVASAIAG